MDNKIKFVYFDVGGVLIKDFSQTSKWEEMIGGWGVAEEKIPLVKQRIREFEGNVCIGKLSIEDFKPILEKEFGIKLPANHSINHDFVDRFYLNKDIWKIIEECQKKYRVGLLTNMYPGLLDLIKNKGLFLFDDWEITVDSSKVGEMKPEEEIYKIAQQKTGVKAEEILFIDNGQKNLEIPKKLGWQTFFYNSADYDKSNEELAKFLG